MEKTPAAACPKCGHLRGLGEDACPRCGLLVVRWEQFAVAEQAAEPAELLPLWEKVTASWQEEAAHDRLLATASALGLLPPLAKRYRARLIEHAGDVAAERRLRQIGAMVEAAARTEGQRAGSPRASRALWWAGYVVAALVLAASLWFVARIFTRR